MTALKKTKSTQSNTLHEFSNESRDPLWDGHQLTSEFLGWIVKVPSFWLYNTTIINQAAKKIKINVVPSRV